MSNAADRPPLEPVVVARTIAGELLLPAADTIITPDLVKLGVWEIPETAYLQRTLRAGQTFVDVGAHVGYYSLLAARLVGPRGTVIALEPEPRNFDLLRRNVARNGASQVRPLQLAAGARAQTMALALDEDNRGGHRLVASDDPQAGPVLRCVRVDDLLPAHVDFVKIDAQGYDHEVIAGLERTLATNPRAIVLAELSRFELARRGIDPKLVLAQYEQLDFVLSLFDATGKVHRVSPAEALAYVADPGSPDDFSLLLQRPATLGFDQDSRPRWAEGLEITETDSGLEVIDPATGRRHELNLTAALVFELCSGERSIAEIVDVVREAYALAEAPLEEVALCLDELRREGVVA